jgi:Protein of unknown function (DUF1353)
MTTISRRKLVLGFGGCALGGCFSDWAMAAKTLASKGEADKPFLSKQEWMEAWMDSPTSRDIEGQFWLGRFLDPMYFLLKPISWKPSNSQARAYQRVQVPAGFVTDLASIPWPLWSTGLRPDGQYAIAAVIHDYLYWTQARKRSEADDILKMGMQDLRVGVATMGAIYAGVRVGGQPAWDANTILKSKGDKRLLKRYPDTATITWAEWKGLPDVFVSDESAL